MAEKVLLVEDNDNVSHLNKSVLERRGYAVYGAKDLRGAHLLLERHADIDIAILDIMLPDGDGLSLAGEIKARLNCPVLMLTGKRGYENVLQGLEIADGYLTKPYRIDELTAHVQALLKKRRKTSFHGSLSLDVAMSRAFLGGKDLLLQPREFAVLYYLAQHEGQFVPVKTLYESVWNLSLEGNVSAVKTTVSRLRKKLEESDYSITAERGVGYCFQLDE